MFKKKPKPHGKVFSIAFLMSIPCNFILGALCLLTALSLAGKYLPPEPEVLSLFALGFIGSLSLISGAEIHRLRVLIHEAKHAIVVLLVGRLKDFKVGRHDGEVKYEIEEDRKHYAPLIALAPYSFPLFTLPAFIYCLLFGEEDKMFAAFFFGLAIGADFAFSYGEIHPHQTDFRQIIGGFLASALYIGSVCFLWAGMASLWIIAGRGGFFYAGYTGYRIVSQLHEDYRVMQAKNGNGNKIGERKINVHLKEKFSLDHYD